MDASCGKIAVCAHLPAEMPPRRGSDPWSSRWSRPRYSAVQPEEGSRVVHKVLESAIANAEHNHGADIDEFTVSAS